MKVILSVAVSLDGYIDDSSSTRLKLSGSEDWDEVLRLRAGSDAILVGAGTVRRDNPSLIIRDDQTRRERVSKGLKADIVKVTVTCSGNLDAGAAFFTEGSGEKIVFAETRTQFQQELPARIVRLENITAVGIVSYLKQNGFESLLVEGGSEILSMFLDEGNFDLLRVSVAPFFVADPAGTRIISAPSLWNNCRRLNLERVEKAGDMMVAYYTPKVSL